MQGIDRTHVKVSRGEAILPAKTASAIGRQKLRSIIAATNGKQPKLGIRSGGSYADGVVDEEKKPKGAGYAGYDNVLNGTDTRRIGQGIYDVVHPDVASEAVRPELEKRAMQEQINKEIGATNSRVLGGISRLFSIPPESLPAMPGPAGQVVATPPVPAGAVPQAQVPSPAVVPEAATPAVATTKGHSFGGSNGQPTDFQLERMGFGVKAQPSSLSESEAQGDNLAPVKQEGIGNLATNNGAVNFKNGGMFGVMHFAGAGDNKAAAAAAPALGAAPPAAANPNEIPGTNGQGFVYGGPSAADKDRQAQAEYRQKAIKDINASTANLGIYGGAARAKAIEGLFGEDKLATHNTQVEADASKRAGEMEREQLAQSGLNARTTATLASEEKRNEADIAQKSEAVKLGAKKPAAQKPFNAFVPDTESAGGVRKVTMVPTTDAEGNTKYVQMDTAGAATGGVGGQPAGKIKPVSLEVFKQQAREHNKGVEISDEQLARYYTKKYGNQ